MVAVHALKDTTVFTPIKVGTNKLTNRIAFAPATRKRALENNVPSDLAVKYYDDRSKYPGSLLITEATIVSPKYGLFSRFPGIYNEEQTKAWKVIVDKVHANGSYISLQLAALGRVADPVETKKAGYPLVGASTIYYSEQSKEQAEKIGNPLQELTTEELKELKKDYVNAVKNAALAGFDYIELHGAHGCMLDQFFFPSSNQRTDKYGGSIENRARYALEIIDELIPVIGADRLAIRISPWATSSGMKGHNEEVSPVAQLGYLLSELQKRARKGNELAYVSVVEPRVSSTVDVDLADQYGDNSFVRSVWKGVVIKAGNYTYDAPNFTTALKDTEDAKTMIAFGRFYTSNPDLVQRLHDGKELAKYDRDTFYTPYNWGYNTFLPADLTLVFDEETERKRLPMPIR